MIYLKYAESNFMREKTQHKLILSVILWLFLSASSAQNYRNNDRYDKDRSGYDRDRYQYCRDQARDITGYRGSRPSEYRRGGALEGALKGASRASGLSWLAGGNKKERKKAAERGAKLGFLIGAIKQGQANKKKKKQNRKRREYQYELDECMDSYYKD